MSSKVEAQRRLFEHLHPAAAGPAIDSRTVDLRRFALMILFCTHENVFADTFPGRGGVDLNTVRQDWFSKDEIPDSVIKDLVDFREAFATVLAAWQQLSGGYQDPPCPDREVFQKVVDLLRRLNADPIRRRD